ncbi:transposase family protein [Streptococcus pneumoniae]|nr:transposase family protein [Streptococcus pneumoniae]
MYQDEAGFGRISKLGSCWSPIGVGPHVHSHYIREFRYCYGAVDAHTGESFFLIAGRCNTEWMNAFLEEDLTKTQSLILEQFLSFFFLFFLLQSEFS